MIHRPLPSLVLTPLKAGIPAVIFAVGMLALAHAGPPMGPYPNWFALPEMSWEPPERYHCCCRRLRVDIRWDGVAEYRVRGEKVSLSELEHRLLVFSERDRDVETGWSEVCLLIRAQRDLPWGEIRKVLDLCLDPDIRIYRILFATVKARR